MRETIRAAIELTATSPSQDTNQTCPMKPDKYNILRDEQRLPNVTEIILCSDVTTSSDGFPCGTPKIT
jgi:hypothetical protein